MLEFDVPPDARACVEAVSEALIAQGVGYASYDLMRGPLGFHLIEANTCAVSTAMWDVSPERYAANYLRAMLRALERIDRVPVWGSLRGTAYRAGHVQAAVPLPEKAAGAADAVTRAPPVGTPPAPASIEQRFFASLTKTERAPPDSLTRHVQTSLQALLHHAHRHSPFQRERLGFLFQWDGSVLWERWQDVPLLRFEDIVSRRHIMQCRVVPLGHGSSMQVRIDGADGAHATLSKSKLQAAAEFCIEARLYQWHGVDFSEDMATLWPAWLSTPAIGSRSSRRHFGVPRLDVALAEGVGADPFAHRNLGGAGTRNNGRRGADVATESQKPVHAGRADGQRNTPPLPRASRTRTDRGVSSRRSRSNRTAMSCVVRPSYPKRSLPCRGRRPKRQALPTGRGRRGGDHHSPQFCNAAHSLRHRRSGPQSPRLGRAARRVRVRADASSHRACSGSGKTCQPGSGSVGREKIARDITKTHDHREKPAPLEGRTSSCRSVELAGNFASID
jgi:hypothetical protein